MGFMPAQVVLISLDGFPADAWADPLLPAPALRKLAAQGASAKRMKTVNPTVTWPNHTALVTGVSPARHGVLYNGMLERPGPRQPVKVEPWRDKAKMVRVPTVYDLAHQAGLTTAQVDWVAIYNAASITWQFPEVPAVGGKIEGEMIAKGLAAESEIANFGKLGITLRDQIWTRAAGHILREHRPNLLLYHLLNLDSTHHTYGPKGLASMSGIAFADGQVKELLEAVDLASTTVFVVSDHGFSGVTRTIRPNAALHYHGLIELKGAAIVCEAYVVPEGGTAMVYALNPAVLPRLKEIFAKIPGIDRVIEPADFAALGMPHPKDYNQMADLVLSAKPGFAFSGAAEGEFSDTTAKPVTGSHGYLSSNSEMDAIFIASGYGVKKGARLDQITNRDVAPTIAKLLGLKMEGVEGRVLDDILE